MLRCLAQYLRKAASEVEVRSDGWVGVGDRDVQSGSIPLM